MSWLIALTVVITLLIWLAAVEWTISGIERDTRLWGTWYRLPRWARIVLCLFAWPLLAIAIVVVITWAFDHE
jgi:hypothetical protein